MSGAIAIAEALKVEFNLGITTRFLGTMYSMMRVRLQSAEALKVEFNLEHR